MTTTSTHEHAAMQRARHLALRGPRGVNPQVGAVILSASGDVIAEGWHQGAGTAHAEVAALAALAPGAARGATAVVTLEPCNHTGRTGPCAVALVEAGIARVVYAVSDPGHESSGGSARLSDAGVEVATLEADEGEALIADWLFVARTGRPRITVKWAQSLDGRAAAADGTSRWITGADARRHVHEQRAAHDAIGIGTGTVIADDPQLTARLDGAAQPIPVVFGTRGVPADAALRDHPRGLIEAGGDIAAGLAMLAERGIQTLYVEGGPTLASSFVAAGLADRIHAYIAPTLIGGPRTAIGDIDVHTINEQLRLEVHQISRLGDDILIEARTASAEG